MRETKDGNKVIAFMNKFFDGRSNLLKEELNKRGFNYNIKADRGSYKSEDYFIKQITPIIKKLGRVPTQQEFSNLGRNDLSVMSKRYYGGLEQLRRNELEEGQMFYVVKNILDNPPYDKKLEWGDKTHETVKKIIKYFNDKGITIPSTLNDLRYDNIYEPFGKPLHTQITGKQIGGWENFKKIFNT